MKEKTFTDTALGVAQIPLAVAFVAALIWVADKPNWLGSSLIVVFIIASYALGITSQVRAENRLDEVELAAVRFGARWGHVAGVAFVLVLTFLPPVQSLLAGFAGALGRTSGYPGAVEPRMFLFGVTCTFAAQEVFRSVLAAAWKWSKR
jgi:hypothetical protein